MSLLGVKELRKYSEELAAWFKYAKTLLHSLLTILNMFEYVITHNEVKMVGIIWEIFGNTRIKAGFDSFASCK